MIQVEVSTQERVPEFPALFKKGEGDVALFITRNVFLWLKSNDPSVVPGTIVNNGNVDEWNIAPAGFSVTLTMG